MKWLLLLMILSGYSGPSKVTVNFDSYNICEAAPKSQRRHGGGEAVALPLTPIAPSLP